MHYTPKRDTRVCEVPLPAFNQTAAIETGNPLLREAWRMQSGLSLEQPTREHLQAVMDWCRELVCAASGDSGTVELMQTMEQLAERNAALETGWMSYAQRMESREC
jgi:hypothetical protein